MPVNLWHWVQALIVCGSLIYAAVDDLKTRTVNDGICILIALAGLLTCSSACKLIIGIIRAILSALPVYLMSGNKDCGAGDVWLVAAIGFVFNFTKLAFGCLLLLVSMVTGMLYQKYKGKSCHTKLPLVPFFAISFIPAYFI